MRNRALFPAVILLVAQLFAGCATMSLVDTTSEASARAGLESQDRISLATHDGRLYELTVVEISDTAIAGVEENGVLVVLPLDAISTLHVHQPRRGMTAAAVTGVVALTATAAKYPVIALAGVLLGWE